MGPTILDVRPLGFPWETVDPFLFCVHHKDGYPSGNGRLGLEKAALAGRNLGMDFSAKSGFSMYHGHMVPGFPRHPHRGFETVSIARRGFIDHSDSLGATARFGQGDVQWMTAGRGIVHSEMFPLLETETDNPLEMFQIWLNLPSASKMVEPHFSMLWSETIPSRTTRDDAGKSTTVTVVAGTLDDAVAPAPPPHSWASDPRADVAIWTVAMEPGATWAMPPAAPGTGRTIYFFAGGSLGIAGRKFEKGVAVRVDPQRAVAIENGDEVSELVILGGRAIGEPVAQEGPFVMNTRTEILEAFADFRETGFGGWPWKNDAPVHEPGAGRFAVHANGRREERS